MLGPSAAHLFWWGWSSFPTCMDAGATLWGRVWPCGTAGVSSLFLGTCSPVHLLQAGTECFAKYLTSLIHASVNFVLCCCCCVQTNQAATSLPCPSDPCHHHCGSEHPRALKGKVAQSEDLWEGALTSRVGSTMES